MAVCRTCGQENPEHARFCLGCAAPLAGSQRAPQRMRKTVTVVFTDLVGSTALAEELDAESVRSVVDRYFEETRAVVRRHGGTVEKFIGDAVMAVFGIPVLHEDDALRAVRAAVGMRDALAALNEELVREHGVSIDVRIGVNTGEVVSGDASDSQRYATGDAVNVASRLQHAAKPGEILIGEDTRRLVRDAVRVEPVRPLALRGKHDLVAAARVLGLAGASAGRLASPLVGRAPELQRLSQTFDDVVSARACRLVTVIGSAGVGKSRLVHEFLLRRSDDATVLRGRCLSYGEGITFWPIKSVVTEAAGLTGTETPRAASQKIRSLVVGAPDADLIVERVADAAGVGNTVPGRRGTSWAIGRFFEELARRRPLVVVLDDIHWGERTFLDVVEAVAAEQPAAPILLLCMARPDLLEVRPNWGEQAASETRLVLSPLGQDDAEHLIGNLLGSVELPPDVRRRINPIAEGNPLFLAEMVAMLVDEETLPNGSIALPPTIQALLGARLDQLDGEERAILERGAVEGKVFHRGAVAELSPPGERARLDDRIWNLLEHEFLQPGRAGFDGEQAFRFRHQLLRDVTYESVPKALRSRLHEQFAGWLEGTAGKRVHEFDEILGHHLEQAYGYAAELGPIDDRGRALATRAASHLGSAGSRAFARGDMSGSGNLLARALALLPSESGARSDYVRKLDEARFELGEYRRTRLSRHSLRCFWQRPVGHTWEMKESRGKPVLRCAACGKVVRGARGWVDKRDNPDPEFAQFGRWASNGD